jgi:hypothetical protein
MMTPGRDQEMIIGVEIETGFGAQEGTARIQRDGIFLSGDKTIEIGLTWSELSRLLEHPAVAIKIEEASIFYPIV